MSDRFFKKDPELVSNSCRKSRSPLYNMGTHHNTESPQLYPGLRGAYWVAVNPAFTAVILCYDQCDKFRSQLAEAGPTPGLQGCLVDDAWDLLRKITDFHVGSCILGPALWVPDHNWWSCMIGRRNAVQTVDDKIYIPLMAKG